MYDLKNLKNILDKYDLPVFLCGMDYCLDKGCHMAATITDEDIATVHGGPYAFVSDEFLQAVVRCGREIALEGASIHTLYTFCAKEVWPQKDHRMEEIATTALSYLNDRDLLEDYLEDSSVDLTEEECDFFGVYPEDEDYEEDDF